jgi:hypothetical protein
MEEHVRESQSTKINEEHGLEMLSVVECLPTMHKTLDLILFTAKKNLMKDIRKN